MKKKGYCLLKSVPIFEAQKVNSVYIQQPWSLSFAVRYVPVGPKLNCADIIEEQSPGRFPPKDFDLQNKNDRQKRKTKMDKQGKGCPRSSISGLLAVKGPGTRNRCPERQQVSYICSLNFDMWHFLICSANFECKSLTA